MAGDRTYLAYLVRLWAVRQDDEVVWRASAENAHTGERRAFADLAGLCGFLKQVTEQRPAREQAESNKTMPEKS